MTRTRPAVLNTRAKLGAIIFGCDGVLVDSERDGHRVALNKAIAEVSCAVSTIIVPCSRAQARSHVRRSELAKLTQLIPGPKTKTLKPRNVWQRTMETY